MSISSDRQECRGRRNTKDWSWYDEALDGFFRSRQPVLTLTCISRLSTVRVEICESTWTTSVSTAAWMISASGRSCWSF